MTYGHRCVTVGFSMALALATACGGSSSNEVGTEGNEGGAADGAANMDSGGEAAAPQEASTGNDGAGPVDAGHGGDSSEPPTEGGATGTIACGMGTTCTAPAQVCCALVGQAAGDAGHSSSCVAAGSCGNGISISCEGTENCPSGDVCCFSGGNGSSSATCEPKCGNGNGVQLCNEPSDCPPSETCHPVAELGGLGFCEAIPHDAGGD